MTAPAPAGPTRTRTRATSGTLVVLLVAVSLLPLVTGRSPMDRSAAGAAKGGAAEAITDYEVTLNPRPDGQLLVHEKIVYDFTPGATGKHGIHRIIPLRTSWNRDYQRVWKLDDLSVRQDGAKASVETQSEDGDLSVQVGDSDKLVKGVHTYDFSYAIRGAFLVRNGRIELAWNAIGTYWGVPIQTAVVSLDPAGVAGTSLTCVYGTVGGNKPCTKSGTGYKAGNVQQYQGMTVGYGFPLGSIAATEPILEHRLTPSWVFLGRRWAVALGVLIALAGLLVSFLRWWRHGRDESYDGQIPGLVPAAGQSAGVVVGRRAAETSVQFTPPADARPAELEVLVTEKATNAGVTATLLDLAQRGALTIRQVEGGRHDDWRLEFPDKQPAAMEKWERHLYDGIASRKGDDNAVLLSEVRYSFATVAAAHRAAALRSATDKGWFTSPPDKQTMAMSRWGALGIGVSVAGLFVAVPLAIGAVAVGLFIAGLSLQLFGRKMPARSALGSAVLAECRAFQRFVQTAELEHIKADERLAVFSRYLPFAVVLGLADRWVRTFQPALAQAAESGASSALPVVWLAGGSMSFDNSFSSFTSGLAGSMSVQSSSSGGSSFSSVGGGGGGGGGGSW
jgi:Predicted membrane protein (DUF2207) C-terminal domain/Predicted membrane protein (DUF2207) N-terminal domain